MEIKILFNNETKNKEFSVGWGFSCLVDGRILFDTGENPRYLLYNMNLMNVSLSDIETVVISHDHWDHTEGLWEVLKRQRGLKVYACPHFSKAFKEEVRKLHGHLIDAEKFSDIDENIFTTGEMRGTYLDTDIPEQSLVVKTENGITVITGCAHPGVIKIIEKVKKVFAGEKIYSTLGGFHLMDKDNDVIESMVSKFKEMEVGKVGPTHCSGKEAEALFREEYKDNFLSIKAGDVLNV